MKRVFCLKSVWEKKVSTQEMLGREGIGGQKHNLASKDGFSA